MSIPANGDAAIESVICAFERAQEKYPHSDLRYKIIHCAVNRVTREGHILGPDERISPYDALKAYSTDAAYCSYEEDRRGSIGSGKFADIIVLSDNPTTISPSGIKDIQVLKTYLGGIAIHDVEESANA